MGRGCPLAEFMESDVGIRSWADRQSPFWRAGPAAALTAKAVVARFLFSLRRVCP